MLCVKKETRAEKLKKMGEFIKKLKAQRGLESEKNKTNFHKMRLFILIIDPIILLLIAALAFYLLK